MRTSYPSPSIVALLMLIHFCANIASANSPTSPNPERNAYFGETHVHTAWSLDSYLGFGVTHGGPEDFYRYSTGQPVAHPGGFMAQITTPLDWAATTEHVFELNSVLCTRNCLHGAS